MIERALEVQKEVYLCFIDYIEEFCRVRHDEIITQLTVTLTDRWTRSMSDKKHVLGTNNGNEC